MHVFPPPETPQSFWAVPADEPLRIDGELSEQVWQRAAPITAFAQREPAEGTVASYATEVRIVFDKDALYIAAICHQPRSAVRVSSLQRDFEFEESDVFGVAIDGFLDRRNALVFQSTPYGSQSDMEVLDAADPNRDWDARWMARTSIRESSWTVEMAIPWSTLRYPAGADRLGVVFARNVRSGNEQATAPAIPRVLPTYRMSYEAELRGIVTPRRSANVQLHPYILHRQAGNAATEELGGEAKWALQPGTVLDVTWNTDFAQADVDRRVTNLNRFDVLFPERRQFFLENAGIFNASVTEWISPFFSRRIGLDAPGRPIALDGGLRLTHRSAAQELGILAMRQPAAASIAATDFAVVRYSHHLAERSRLGGMLTYRGSDHDNHTRTVDGLWRPTESFGLQAMLSFSEDERSGDGVGAQLWAFLRTDRVSLSVLEYYDRDYDPGVGLELLDANYVMHSLSASYELRSRRLPAAVRSIVPGVSFFVFNSSDDGELLFSYAPIRPLRVAFQSGAQVDLYIEPNRQRLVEPFAPAGIEVAPGRYDYVRYRGVVKTDQSAWLAATLTAETGEFFDGRLTTYVLSGRIAPTRHFELSFDMEMNEIDDLGSASRDDSASLYGISGRIAPNPRLQLSGSYQWDVSTDASVWNLRLSWEFRPLSYLYIVYNKNTSGGPYAVAAREQQWIAKLTYLFDL